MIQAGRGAARVAALALVPLALLRQAPAERLPAGLAYLAHAAAGFVLLAAALAALAVLAAPLARRLESWLAEQGGTPSLQRPAARLALTGTGLAVALALMPGWRWHAPAFGGDEPKYLRIADSLYHDLDADIASQDRSPWTLPRFARQARRLVRDAGEAVGRLFRPVSVPEDHRWNLGNWTLGGLNGGRYHVQSPGLPLLLLPGRIAQAALAPDRPDSYFPLLTLALFLALALWQTSLLAAEASGSPAAGVGAALLALASAPLLVGGFHFYPESAAVPLLPWLLRHARARGPAPGLAGAAALGLGCGLLAWLHPKFLPVELVLAAMLAAKLRPRRRALAALAVPLLLATGALLLYDHAVTGLLAPDALYRRYGSEVYRGPSAVVSPLMLNGLVTALFGARDGLFVMAPILLAGALAVGVAWRSDRRATLELLAVFAALWLSAAVHEGGAPGPPGRLLAPVACVPAALLAVGLVQLRRSLPYLSAVAWLSALTIAITAAMLEDWRRTVNPYREMFKTPQLDFSRDLPDGPGRPEGAPREQHKAQDRWRGALLLGLLWAWGAGLARARPDAAPAAQMSAACAAAWITLAAASLGLSALGP